MVNTQSPNTSNSFHARVFRETDKRIIGEEFAIDDIITDNVIGDLDGHSSGYHAAATLASVGPHKLEISEKVRNFRSDHSIDAASIERAIECTPKMGARINSNSWGGGGPNQAIYDAFKAVNERNTNDPRLVYPTTFDLPNAISVAATDHEDNLANFSNWSATTVDPVAPSVETLSSTSGSDTEHRPHSPEDRIISNSWGGGGDSHGNSQRQALAKTAQSLGHEVASSGFILAK